MAAREPSRPARWQPGWSATNAASCALSCAREADEREGTAEQRELERRKRAGATAERRRQAGLRDQAQINREFATAERELAGGEWDQEARPDREAREQGQS